MDTNRLAKIGILLIAVALAIGVAVLYFMLAKQERPIIFSERAMLSSIWENYKREYLEPGTYRTIDKQRGGITTSEGQSYTMLRSVWMDDKETFDKSYAWTKDNLGRQEDRLFSWLFGQREDGTYGVITSQGGSNTASDADTDIALALVFAWARWGDEAYRQDAEAVMVDIWEQEVVLIQGRPYMAANNLEKKLEKDFIVVNPSYFVPYAYRIFSKIDKAHPWEDLVTTSYDVIKASSGALLDTRQSAGIPPDWITVNRTSGEINAPGTDVLTTDYSYDALRLPWRLALDRRWYREDRAKEALDGFHFLSRQWEEERKIRASYSHAGEKKADYEAPAMYGGSIGYFVVSDLKQAREVYESKLASLYNPDKNGWKETLSYYDDNWAWFGIALYTYQLPNLADSITEARP